MLASPIDICPQIYSKESEHTDAFFFLLFRPAHPLDGDFLQLLENTKYGVILVSFGSHVGDFPDSVLQKFLDAFSHLSYDVIWKFSKNKTPSNVPENVHLVQWIPQNDLLGHQNVKLFISHCGINSVMESIYHQVPVLAMPFCFDQFHNAAFLVSRGFGIELSISTFTEMELLEAIGELLGNPKYDQNLHKASMIIRDMQQNNVTNPSFWISHVIKHGDQHLKSHAYQLAEYEFLMLDVFGFLFITILLLIFLFYKLLKLITRLYYFTCCGYKNLK